MQEGEVLAIRHTHHLELIQAPGILGEYCILASRIPECSRRSGLPPSLSLAVAASQIWQCLSAPAGQCSAWQLLAASQIQQCLNAPTGLQACMPIGCIKESPLYDWLHVPLLPTSSPGDDCMHASSVLAGFSLATESIAWPSASGNFHQVCLRCWTWKQKVKLLSSAEDFTRCTMEPTIFSCILVCRAHACSGCTPVCPHLKQNALWSN